MAFPPPDKELDFGKLVVIDKSYDATEEDVRINCRANKAQKIWESSATEAELMLLDDMQSALSIIDVALDHPIDVFFVDGNKLDGTFLTLKFGSNSWFPEIGATDFKALHNMILTYFHCITLREHIDAAVSLASGIGTQIKKQGFSDPTITQSSVQLNAIQGNLAISLMSDIEAEVKRIMRNAW